MKTTFLAVGLLSASLLSAAPSNYTFGMSADAEVFLVLSTDIGADAIPVATRGWVNSAGVEDYSGDYLAGFCGSDEGTCGGTEFQNLDYRNVFSFNLPELNTTLRAARLIITQPSGGYLGTLPSLTYIANDVPSGLKGLDLYNALGTGTVYGDATVTEATEGTQVVVELNAAAKADILASLGSSWSVGGYVPNAAVPEPASIFLVACGCAALAFRRGER